MPQKPAVSVSVQVNLDEVATLIPVQRSKKTPRQLQERTAHSPPATLSVARPAQGSRPRAQPCPSSWAAAVARAWAEAHKEGSLPALTEMSSGLVLGHRCCFRPPHTTPGFAVTSLRSRYPCRPEGLWAAHRARPHTAQPAPSRLPAHCNSPRHPR